MSQARASAGGQEPNAAGIEDGLQLLDDRFFVDSVIAHAGPAAVRKHLEAAGYNVDKTGRLIAKRGDCAQCGRYSRLHGALNEDRFLCPLCWHEDLCST